MDPGYSRAAIGLLALVFLTAQQVAASQSVPASPSPSATVTASQTPSIIAVPPILGNVSTAAGSTTGYADGVGSAAQFNDPEGVALGAGFLLVADLLNNVVRFVELSSKNVTTLAGTVGVVGYADGQGSAASFVVPADSLWKRAERLRTSRTATRTLSAASTYRRFTVTTVAGVPDSSSYADGVGTSAEFNTPRGIAVAVSRPSSFALVADRFNFCIRRVDLTTSAVTTFVGNPSSINYADGIGTSANFQAPWGVTINGMATFALVSDAFSNVIRLVELSSALVTTLAGGMQSGFADGVGTLASFNFPAGVSMDAGGTFALVADCENEIIRRIDISSGTVTSIAGVRVLPGTADGLGTTARFNMPRGIILDGPGSTAYVADYGNDLIRSVTITATRDSDSQVYQTAVMSRG